MKHRLLAIASALSLLSCVAVVTLWVGSFKQVHELRVQRPYHSASIAIKPGTLFLLYQRDFLHPSPTAVDIFTTNWGPPGRDIRGMGSIVSTFTSFHGIRHFDVRDRYGDPPLLDHLLMRSLAGFRFDREGVYYGNQQGRIWYTAGIPLVPVLSVLVAMPALFTFRIVRRSSRRRAGRCDHCNYDLRASAGRCPECGALMPAKVGATG